MALTPLALKNALLTTAFYSDEASAIAAWGSAWADYFKLAAANEVPVLPLGVDTAVEVMKLSMVGLSVTGAAALQTGITAFWGAMVAAPVSCWIGAKSLTPPPGLAGLGAALIAVFAANTVAGLSKDASMEAIAGAIHPLQIGGTIVYPDPVGAYPII